MRLAGAPPPAEILTVMMASMRKKAASHKKYSHGDHSQVSVPIAAKVEEVTCRSVSLISIVSKDDL